MAERVLSQILLLTQPNVIIAMTEASQTPDAPKTVNISVGIGAQYIKDMSFESPNAPMIFNDLMTQPQMSMDVNVMSRSLAQDTYEAVLKIKLESKLGEKVAFIAELAYAGIFTVSELPEEQLRLFLLVEAPRLMFPFARAIISNAVRDGGFPNVALQPIDFMSLYAAQRAQMEAAVPAGVA